MKLSPSAIETFLFRGRDFYVKRDDTIDPLLSGNKYRKLYTLLQTAPQDYTKILSYGGIQSNAMLSIAALCHQKGWEFHYTAKTIPSSVKRDVTGNLKMAMELGMKLHEVSPADYDAEIALLRSKESESTTLLVSQGGADPLAQQGVEVLADEIRAWKKENRHTSLTIVTPSGTGTTAYYLAQALPEHTIVTTPVIGDSAYLLTQLARLGSHPENLQLLQSEKKYHFGKPYAEFLKLYRELKQSGLEFDLLYGTKMWLVLLENMESLEGDILYVHSGGIIGNETMLERYVYKGMS